MERHGSFADLPQREPYDGIRLRTFDTDGATVNEYSLAPGAGFPVHRHPEEQIAFVTEGEIELTVAGEQMVLRAGDWSAVSGGVEHGLRAGASGARLLAVVVPRRTGPITIVEP